LQTTGAALVQLPQWRDDGRDGRTAQRLIHRPERVFRVAYTEDDKPIEPHSVSLDGRWIEIPEPINQNNAPMAGGRTGRRSLILHRPDAVAGNPHRK